MKWFFILTICLLASCSAGNRNIERTYYNLAGCCRIYADTMDIYRPDLLICDQGVPQEEKYILSTRCTVKNIEGEFYSINSITSPDSLLFKDIRIEKIELSENSDSTDVEFILPNYDEREGLKIIAHTDTEYEAIQEGGRYFLRLPLSCKEFTLEVMPMSYLTYFMPKVFYGLVRFRYNKPIHCDAATKTTVILPGVTDDVLGDYYLNNEYIRITHNGVYMLGEFWECDTKRTFNNSEDE